MSEEKGNVSEETKALPKTEKELLKELYDLDLQPPKYTKYERPSTSYDFNKDVLKPPHDVPAKKIVIEPQWDPKYEKRLPKDVETAADFVIDYAMAIIDIFRLLFEPVNGVIPDIGDLKLPYGRAPKTQFEYDAYFLNMSIMKNDVGKNEDEKEEDSSEEKKGEEGSSATAVEEDKKDEGKRELSDDESKVTPKKKRGKPKEKEVDDSEPKGTGKHGDEKKEAKNVVDEEKKGGKQQELSDDETNVDTPRKKRGRPKKQERDESEPEESVKDKSAKKDRKEDPDLGTPSRSLRSRKNL